MNLQDSEGNNAVILAAQKGGDMGLLMVDALCKQQSADLEMMSIRRKTPLKIACAAQVDLILS